MKPGLSTANRVSEICPRDLTRDRERDWTIDLSGNLLVGIWCVIIHVMRDCDACLCHSGSVGSAVGKLLVCERWPMAVWLCNIIVISLSHERQHRWRSR